jgi:hypothetical protein
MKGVLAALLLLLFGTLTVAQGSPQNPPNSESAFRVTGSNASANGLPDSPEPKPIKANPKLAATPCPAGIAKPCALLGGRLYFRDSLHATEHDRTWLQAMSHPAMIVGTALLAGSFIADYKTTRSCVDRNLGHEANPLMGQSRAQELGVGISITALGVFATGKLKKTGNGNAALFTLWSGTVLHGVMAARNVAICGS